MTQSSRTPSRAPFSRLSETSCYVVQISFGSRLFYTNLFKITAQIICLNLTCFLYLPRKILSINIIKILYSFIHGYIIALTILLKCLNYTAGQQDKVSTPDVPKKSKRTKGIRNMHFIDPKYMERTIIT